MPLLAAVIISLDSSSFVADFNLDPNANLNLNLNPNANLNLNASLADQTDLVRLIHVTKQRQRLRLALASPEATN